MGADVGTQVFCIYMFTYIFRIKKGNLFRRS